MSYSTAEIFYMAAGGASLIALILNIIGIYLLKAAGLGSTIQIKLIIKISICDILLSTGTLVAITMHILGYTLHESKAAQVIWALGAGVYNLWFILFYFLTLDRFLGCNFPFKYRNVITPRIFKLLFVTVWGLSTILAVIIAIIDTMKVREFYNKFMWLIYDCIFLFLFITTYASVFYRKRQSMKIPGRRRSSGFGNQRFIALTGVMLLAFLVFETIPTIGSSALAMVSIKTRDFFQFIFEHFWTMNVVVDPIIYVFLLPTVRITAVNKIRSLRDIIGRNRVLTGNSAENCAQAANSTTNDEENK